MTAPRETAAIPVYDLYGETGPWAQPEMLHCESIATRSSLHHWEIRPHRHESLFQILFMKSGGAEITFDGKSRRVKGPLAIVIPARVVHGFAFSPDVEGHVITLPEMAVARLLPDPPDEAALIDLKSLPMRLDEIEGYVAAIVREFSSTDPDRMRALESLTTLLLVALRRCRAHLARETADAGRLRLEKRVADFYRLVEDHYASGQTVESYASRLGVTSVQLNRSLQKMVGKPALGIIHDRLILEAKRNLVYTRLTVGDIAELLGFADVAYFSRFFSKRTGQSPRQFRAWALQSIR